MKVTIVEFDKIVDVDNFIITRLKKLKIKAIKELKTWRKSHDHTFVSTSKTKSTLKNAKQITIQISVNFDETLIYIKKLEKKNKVFQKKMKRIDWSSFFSMNWKISKLISSNLSAKKLFWISIWMKSFVVVMQF